jgi:hypothetical protein
MSPNCSMKLHSSMFYCTVLAQYNEENHLVHMLFYVKFTDLDLAVFSNVHYYVLDFFVRFT